MDSYDEVLHTPLSRKDLLKAAGVAGATAALAGPLVKHNRALAAAPAPTPSPVITNLGTGSKTVTIWDGLGGPDGDTFAKMLKLFVQKNPDIRIQHEVLDWGVYYQKVPTAILAGSPPDFIVNDAYGMPQFASRSMLQPLDNLVFQKNLLTKSDFSSQQLQVGSWNGQVYGVPLWDPIIGFFMNNNLVRAAGLNPNKPPMTGAEFTEWAIRLTTDTHGRHPDQPGFDSRNIHSYGVSMGWLFHSEISTLWQFGGDVTNADHTKCLLDAPESIASLDYWVNLVNHHTHVPIVPPYVDATWTNYGSGRLAMVVEGSWQLNWFRQHPQYMPPTTTMWELPQWGPVKKSVWWTAHVMSIPQGISDQNAEIVARLIAFLSDQTSWGALEAGHLPARLSLQNQPAIAKNWWTGPLAQEQRGYGEIEWYSPNYNQINTYYMAAWGAALTGSQSSKSALQQATQLIDGVLK